MSGHSLLFSAPLDFDATVMDEYNRAFERVVYGDYRGGPFDVWVCNPKTNFVIYDAVLRGFPNLKILATPSTGTNHIDLDACRRYGVRVLSLLDDRIDLKDISASAEFTFKLLLDMLRRPPARELQGKYVGLVGYGRIGHKLEKYLTAFDARVMWYDPFYRGGWSLNSMLKGADAVVVCCALNEETKGMLTGERIRMLKPGAVLVNTARGEIICEDEMIDVLRARRDLRVAVDVVCGETTGTAHPERLKEVGVTVTPHIAGETFESRTKAARIILNLVKAYL